MLVIKSRVCFSLPGKKKKKCGNDINLQKLPIAYRTYKKIQKTVLFKKILNSETF